MRWNLNARGPIQGHRDRLRVTSPSENRHRKHTTGVALSLHLIALHFPLLHF